MGVYEDDQGNQYVSIQLSWTAASPADLDLSRYVVAWSQDNSDWQEMSVDRALTSCRIFGLELGEGYYFRIKAEDRAGNESAWVNFNAGAIITMPTDVTGPDTPTNLTTYSRFKSVHLTWTNPAQKDLARIDVYRYSAEANFWANATKIAEVTGTSYTNEIGVWDSTWWYGLKAIDKVGNPSTGTAAVEGNTDITAPAAPTNLSTSTSTVTDADGHIIPYIDCAWTDSVTEDVQSHEVEVQYYISAAWKDPTTFRCLGTPLRISPAVGNVNYRVRVRALDDANLPSAWTAHDTGTVAKDTSAPAAPTNLGLTGMYKSIDLTWDNPNDADFLHVDVYRYTSNNSGASSKIAALDGTRLTIAQAAGTTRWYWLKAVDTSGNASNFSSGISGAPDSTAPAVPTGLNVSSGTSLDADGGQNAYLNIGWNANTEDDFDHYELYWSVGSKKGSKNTRERSHYVSVVPANVGYSVKVRAVDGVGNASAYCAAATGTTAKDTSAPATPAGLTVTAAKKAIRIKVTRPSERDWAVTEFHVSTSNGFTPGAGTLIHSGKTTAHTYQTASYVVHYVRVRHGDTSGNWSNYCAEGSATPQKIAPNPDIPDGSIPSDKMINVEWAKIVNAAIVNADIVNLSVGKLDAGTITVAINIDLMGTLTFASAGGAYLQGATTFIKCFGDFGTAANDDISSGTIVLDSSASTVWTSVLSASGNVIGGAFKIGVNEVIDAARKFVGSAVNVTGNCDLGNTDFHGWIARFGGDTLTCEDNFHVVGDITKTGECTAIEETSQGWVKLGVIESPEVWYVDFQKPGEPIDPLFLEVTVGQLFGCLVYPIGEDGLLRGAETPRMMVIGTRRGYGGKRFEKFEIHENEIDDTDGTVNIQIQHLEIEQDQVRFQADAEGQMLGPLRWCTISASDYSVELSGALQSLREALTRNVVGMTDKKHISIDRIIMYGDMLRVEGQDFEGGCARSLIGHIDKTEMREGEWLRLATVKKLLRKYAERELAASS